MDVETDPAFPKSQDVGHRRATFDALAVLEATPSPYLILNPDFTIAGVNDAYLRATSTVRKQIVGRGIFEVFPDNPNDPHATGERNLKASLERVLKTRAPDRMAIQKYDIPVPNSAEFEERHWSPLNTPVFDANGRLIYIIHHVEDVTETVKLKLEKSQIEESELKFREIANAMPQMVWSARADGFHDYFNDRFYEWTGISDGASFGDKWLDLVHPDDRNPLMQAWRRSLDSGEPYSIEYRIRTKTGDYRWMVARALPIRNSGGKLVRWMGTSTDIHEQKLAQQILNDVIRSREEFFAIASHELKSPLTAMLLPRRSTSRNWRATRTKRTRGIIVRPH